MGNRVYLKNKILLCGESDGVKFKRTFTIVKKINEGASSVCYEAYHGNSGRGILKEFYPEDSLSLERNKDGQLINSQEFMDAHERFIKDENLYLEPYNMLINARQNSENRDLATFIPYFEIYYGCDEDENIIGTVYIWTPNPELETFDKICDQIHKHPKKDPEKNLVTVLTAIESLTKAICALHCAEMIHGDINPFNFGFIKMRNETLTQTISMFDVNSISSVYSEADTHEYVGTCGFIEPEAMYGFLTNQTDIYSIGATLFYALIVCDETKENGYLYKDEYFDRIKDFVNESKIINASEANSHPRLKNILTVILEKCLSKRANRYRNCDMLLEDLNTALYYALPNEVAKKRLSGEQWVLANVEKSLDKNKEKNSLMSIGYHLFENPLYEKNDFENPNLNVVLFGLGSYGEKFLDTCLQAGQMHNKKLNINVITDNVTDKDIYLEYRPALKDFFSIDSELKNTDDSYGNINFITKNLEYKNSAKNLKALSDILFDEDESSYPNYIFIAMGDDELNLSAAKLCSKACSSFNVECSVNYICDNKEHNKTKSADIHPLYINESVKNRETYNDVERMAFNMHLIWNKDLNVNFEKIKKDFKNPYYHDSSVSSAFSLKYKLYSIGIDIDKMSCEEAAKKFNDILAHDDNNALLNGLIWIEHKRWVTEKLCQGWTRLSDFNYCISGGSNNKKTKQHICLVKSEPNRKLLEEYNTDGVFKKWDTASDKEVAELDPLDRLSVDLHRFYVKKANQAKQQNLLNGHLIASIKLLIDDSRDARVAFTEWFTCLKNINNGDFTSVGLYNGLKEKFIESLDGLKPEKQISLKKQVDAFEAEFSPIKASMEYTDWKKTDVDIILSIPFILTYNEKINLVIPFCVGNNNNIFNNVSAASVVGPSNIVYLYYVQEEEDILKFENSMSYVLNYMLKKNFKASIDLVVFYAEDMESLVYNDLKDDLKKWGKSRIKHVDFISAQDIEDVPSICTEYLSSKYKSKIIAAEKNTTLLSGYLGGSGFYKSFNSYKFDSEKMKFKNFGGCDMLGYIRKEPYITVADMTAFSLSSSESSNQPEFFEDYKSLWDYYSNNSGVWKKLCGKLKDYSKAKDLLEIFTKKNLKEKKEEADKYIYILPFACQKAVSEILSFLIEHRILEKNSFITGYTSDSCKVVIYDKCDYHRKYNNLFSNIYALMQNDSIRIYLDTKSHNVCVCFDDLVVDCVNIETNRSASILNYLRDKGYIINLNIKDDYNASFIYATRQIKDLLTCEGRILEIYTYHKAKEIGKFDDVVSSFEVEWDDVDTKNEFDCLITKGFKSLFIECKACNSLNQEFYHKLADLTDQFGINATAVLVADTQEKPYYDNAPYNNALRKMGSKRKIITVWKKDEIDNIGETLLKIAEGTYVSD